MERARPGDIPTHDLPHVTDTAFDLLVASLDLQEASPELDTSSGNPLDFFSQMEKVKRDESDKPNKLHDFTYSRIRILVEVNSDFFQRMGGVIRDSNQGIGKMVPSNYVWIAVDEFASGMVVCLEAYNLTLEADLVSRFTNLDPNGTGVRHDSIKMSTLFNEVLKLQDADVFQSVANQYNIPSEEINLHRLVARLRRVNSMFPRYRELGVIAMYNLISTFWDRLDPEANSEATSDPEIDEEDIPGN